MPYPGLQHPEPPPLRRPLMTRTSTGDTQTFKGRAGSVSVGSPGTHKVLFELFERRWWMWDLILSVISPLLPSCWDFSFALGCEVSFFGGIQHFLLMAVQQWVEILEFFQEKMSWFKFILSIHKYLSSLWCFKFFHFLRQPYLKIVVGVAVQSLSYIQLFVTLWTAAR